LSGYVAFPIPEKDLLIHISEGRNPRASPGCLANSGLKWIQEGRRPLQRMQQAAERLIQLASMPVRRPST
jgi:hypothetical protein